MKLKLLAAASLVAFSTMVSAQSSLTIGYALQDDASPAVQKHVNSIRFQTKLDKNLDGDIGMSKTVADVANTITTRYEAGLTYKQPVASWVTASLRGAVGERQPSGKDSYYYYSVEPALTFKTPISGLDAKVGYRWRDTVQDRIASTRNDRNETTRYQLSYALTKVDKIAVGYDIQKGDGANTTTTLQYQRAF
jgi:hypothetical protein